MSDFHRSLDRALGLAPCRGYEASDERLDYAIPYRFMAGADVSQFVEQKNEAIRNLIAGADLDLAHREIPAEGTE